MHYWSHYLGVGRGRDCVCTSSVIMPVDVSKTILIDGKRIEVLRTEWEM